jgi:hypothetical protein
VVGLAQFGAGRVAIASMMQPASAGKRPGSAAPAGVNQLVGKLKEWFQDFF